MIKRVDPKQREELKKRKEDRQLLAKLINLLIVKGIITTEEIKNNV